MRDAANDLERIAARVRGGFVAYDPCWHPVTENDVRTISLAPLERAVVSVFFRVHRTCAEADPATVLEIEHRIIEGEFALAKGEM